jgi:hypothetical protein
MMGMVNMRILEFRERIRQQEELVASLQRKLEENSLRLK